MIRLRSGVKHLVRRFRRSQRGNVAMMAGIALPVLLMISAGAIDLHHMAKVRSELQDALDAATLAAARSSSINAAEVQNIGMASLRANMPKYYGSASSDVAKFVVNSNFQVEATTTINVKTIVANIFLPPYGKLFDDYIPMTVDSAVMRSSRNVEVAIALDVTGSMSSHMSHLRAAAKDLVRIVVNGNQDPFTTRVALVPYAAAVNAGTYANALRGSLITDRPQVASASWLEAAKSLTSISNTDKKFNLNDHGLKDGDSVYLSDFDSKSELNGKFWTVESVDTNSFKIKSPPSNIRTKAGRFRKCLDSSCNLVVRTSVIHNLTDNELVRIENTSGISGLNGYHQIKLYQVDGVVDAYRFVVPIAATSSNFANTISGNNRRVLCGRDGCANRIFQTYGTDYNTSPKFIQRLTSSNCVSERPRPISGSNGARPAVTDGSPSDAGYIGRAYLSGGCGAEPIMPLTNVVSTLETSINKYTANGSTAGQAGIEMAWYMISPNFGAIGDVSPKPFNPHETVKAVVLMTDGEFNTEFCEGVKARSDSRDAGSNSYKINCDSTNGNGYQQSIEICNAMKSQGIIVYTVAFNLSSRRGGPGIDTAVEVMENCATSENEHFFEANSGTDLKEAFKQIGRDITRLRIAR